MNAKQEIADLRKQYPGKRIVVNTPENPTEIICEIESASKHPDYSVAIAVIDESVEHYHRITKEIYEVIKGELKIFKDGKKLLLRKGDFITIYPGEKHKAEGHVTWIKVTSSPGWSDKDHFVVE